MANKFKVIGMTSGKEYTLSISEMTGKLKGIPAINTNPLSNKFCQAMHKKDTAICKYCYSIAMCEGSRKNCVEGWEQNGITLSTELLEMASLPRFNNAWFRFSAHGELINTTHLINLMLICQVNPQTRFTLWTKRTDLVELVAKVWNKPENLTIIYSDPEINGSVTSNMLHKWFDKIFTVWEKNSPVPINCGAKSCMSCGLCYAKNDEFYINEELKKRS